MPEDGSRDVVLESCRTAYTAVTREHRASRSTRNRALGFGLTLLGVGFGLGFRDGIWEFIAVVPVGMAIVGFAWLYNLRTDMALSGYKRFLEERMNQLAGEAVMRWEEVTNDLRSRWEVNARILAVAVGAVFVTAIALGFREVQPRYGLLIGVLYIGANLALGLAAALSLYGILGESDRVWEAFSEEHGRDVG